jgi:hypothetical protein
MLYIPGSREPVGLAHPDLDTLESVKISTRKRCRSWKPRMQSNRSVSRMGASAQNADLSSRLVVRIRTIPLVKSASANLPRRYYQRHSLPEKYSSTMRENKIRFRSRVYRSSANPLTSQEDRHQAVSLKLSRITFLQKDVRLKHESHIYHSVKDLILSDWRSDRPHQSTTLRSNM